MGYRGCRAKSKVFAKKRPVYLLLRSTVNLIKSTVEQNTNPLRKKCPPQEPVFLHTFLTLKKVWRQSGRDATVLLLTSQ